MQEEEERKRKDKEKQEEEEKIMAENMEKTRIENDERMKELKQKEQEI